MCSTYRRVASGVIVAVAAACVPRDVSLRGESVDFGGYRPHYQGFGVKTPGGRGGRIHRVTNLNDSGPGSLRAGLTTAGPRFVVFDISGTVTLSSPIYVTEPFLTLAGQTAPSPGITVRDHSIFIDTNNVVLQHVRFRMGDAACVDDCAAGGSDVLHIRNQAFDIVLDHLSISWGTHGGLSVNAWSGPHQPYDVAVLDCIISENLAKRPTPFGTGTLFMPSPRGTATFARNLSAHNGNRNPWVSTGWRFSGYNNVAYNAAGVEGDQGTLAFFQIMGGYPGPSPFDVVWVSNITIAGPDTHPDTRAIKVNLPAPDAALSNRLYLQDNTGPHQILANQWAGVTFQGAAEENRIKATLLPAWHTDVNFAILPNASVLAHVLENAGARPLDRDSVDARVVADVAQRDGSRIASQREVGGWPALAVTRQAYTVPRNPNEPGNCGTTTGGVMRTAIECDLEARARRLEPTTRK